MYNLSRNQAERQEGGIEPHRNGANSGIDSARLEAFGSQGRGGARKPAADGCQNHTDEQLENIEAFGISATGGIEHYFRRNMGIWDKNSDGWVSKEELDQAQFDEKTAKEGDIATWHVLRKNIDKLQNLSDDEYGFENDGVTLKDIQRLQLLRNREESASKQERELLHEVAMSQFDAEKVLQSAHPAQTQGDLDAKRGPRDPNPVSYSSLITRDSLHYVYHEQENPDYPGVSYPSKPMQLLTDALVTAWPKEVHDYLTKEHGGRYQGVPLDIDLEKLKRESPDGRAFHEVPPGTVVDIVHNDGRFSRNLVVNPNWTVEQRAEARGYSQHTDIKRIFKDNLPSLDANKNGAVSDDEVRAALDHKFESKETAILLGALFESGHKLQNLEQDVSARTGKNQFEVTAADIEHLGSNFNGAVEALRNGEERITESPEWLDMRDLLGDFNKRIDHSELATGGPKPGSTYRDLWKIAINPPKLRNIPGK